MSLVGNGSRVEFESSGFVADILGISLGDIVRDAIDATSASTINWMQFTPKANIDPSSCELDIAFDPDNLPDIHGDPEIGAIAVNEIDWFAEMFISKIKFGRINSEGLMTAQITLKISGIIDQRQLNILLNDDDEEVSELDDTLVLAV